MGGGSYWLRWWLWVGGGSFWSGGWRWLLLAGGGGSFWHRLQLSEAVGGCSPCLHDAVASPIVSAVCVLSKVCWRLMRDEPKRLS